MKGNRLAIITHAGGPAVMLTDALEAGGLHIPQIVDSPQKQRLKELLSPGSSVENPIDFLATGTADQLAAIIDACDRDFDEIDGMAVIYGSPGLFPVRDVYEMLNKKMHSCRKPIYPILLDLNVKDEVEELYIHSEECQLSRRSCWKLFSKFTDAKPHDEQFSGGDRHSQNNIRIH